MPAESVFSTITDEYYKLTAAEKKTADFVMAHQAQVQSMSISELASESSVAEATISRFCKRLGYKGYNAFKIALANSVVSMHGELSPLSGEITEEDSFDDVCKKLYTSDVAAITQTLKLIDQESIIKAADLLEKAEKVLCMGQGASMVIAQEAAHLFSTVTGKYFPISDSHMQAIAAANINPGDVILYFSYSGATKDMLDTISLAKSNGAKTILITRFQFSPGAKLSDVVLLCGAQESPLQLGSVAARIAQLYLMDVLFSEVCRRHLDDCLCSRSRVANALADKHV